MSEVVFGDDLGELSMIVLFGRFQRFGGMNPLNLGGFSIINQGNFPSKPSMFELDFEFLSNKVHCKSNMQKSNHIILIMPLISRNQACYGTTAVSMNRQIHLIRRDIAGLLRISMVTQY